MNHGVIQSLLEDSLWPLSNARYSAFQFVLMRSGEILDSGHGGHFAASPEAEQIDKESVFDLASVTKLYTATLASILHDAGEVDLDEPIGNWFEVGQELGALRARELLTHTSGLPPWWEEQANRQDTIKSLLALTPLSTQGGQLVYSCTGYALYAVGLEQYFGLSFEKTMRDRLLDPLGLDGTIFNPAANSVAAVVAREVAEEVPRDVVHDPRARALQGISGNAGLFADAHQVARFLDALVGADSSIISTGARKQLFTPTVDAEWQQGIGFRHRDIERLGDAAHFFSHSGFTGTLAMVDPASKTSAVLLTNRLQCGTTREEMAEVYKAFASSVGSQVG